MSEEALQTCVDRHLEHAATVFLLDDELGTYHGLSWADFVLLTVLDAAGGAAPATELAHTLRTPASHLLRLLLPLEKTGLVERAADGDGKRRVMLRPQGRRLVREARDAAANACARIYCLGDAPSRRNSGALRQSDCERGKTTY